MQQIKHTERIYHHYFLDLLVSFYFLASQENLYRSTLGCFLDGCFSDDCFLDGCFLDYHLVTLSCQKLILILQLWASQKVTLQQNSLRKNWMPEQLSGLLIHCHRHSTLASQTFEGLHQL